MQAYQFKHKETSVVRAGVSNGLYIVLSAQGTGAQPACEAVEEMVLYEGRKLLGYPAQKIAYLLSEQLRLASETLEIPISCSIAFAAADEEEGDGWLFSAGSAAAYYCDEKGIQKALTAEHNADIAACFPEHWEDARFESFLLPANGALAACADPAAIQRLRRPILEKLRDPAFPKRTKADLDYSYAMLLMEEPKEVQEDV